MNQLNEHVVLEWIQQYWPDLYRIALDQGERILNYVYRDSTYARYTSDFRGGWLDSTCMCVCNTRWCFDYFPHSKKYPNIYSFNISWQILSFYYILSPIGVVSRWIFGFILVGQNFLHGSLLLALVTTWLILIIFKNPRIY